MANYINTKEAAVSMYEDLKKENLVQVKHSMIMQPIIAVNCYKKGLAVKTLTDWLQVVDYNAADVERKQA